MVVVALAVGGFVLRDALAGVGVRVAADMVLRRVPRDPAVGAALCSRPEHGPVIVLAVASDSRADLPAGAGLEFGTLTGRRADVVGLVALDRQRGEVRWLHVPREMRVASPRYGPLVLAEMLEFGGSAAIATALRDTLGVPVHHYLEVDFAGAAELVDAIGGVVMDFAHPAKDTESGLLVDAGTQRVDGETAVAFARSRRYQELHHVSWVEVAAGTETRRDRQEQLLRAVLHRLRTRVDIFDVPDLFGAVPEAVVIDDRFGSGVASDAVRSAMSATFEFRGLPTRQLWTDAEQISPFGDHLGGGLYLVPTDEAGAAATWLAGAPLAGTAAGCRQG